MTPSITAQSINATFRAAGFFEADDDVAAKMAESMAYSGYSTRDFQRAMQATRPTAVAQPTPNGAVGG